MELDIKVHKLAKCKRYRIATEFLEKQDWPKKLTDRRFDRCYCESCYPSNFKDTYVVGGSTYVVPRGHTRIGVRVDEAQANQDQIWDTWANCYHGTSSTNAKSIIEHRSPLMPGDKTREGNVISIRTGHIPKQNFFFTTPSINYASCYATCHDYKSPSDRQSYKITVVLQCKQRPGSFFVQPETVGARDKGIRLCPFIENSVMEWKCDQRASNIVYGVLLHVHPVDGRANETSNIFTR